MERVLVGTLFSDVKDYAIRDYFKNVCKFSHPNFDFCAVDNSKDKKYHKKIFNYFSEHKKNSNIGKLTVLHAPRVHPQSEVFMAFSANELRKHFLKHNYDWLLYLECDIFPPIDILERLLCFNKPIISGLYFTGEGKTSYPMIDGKSFYLDGMRINPMGYLQGFYDIKDWLTPRPVINSGLGCSLIYKDVIERIPFRADDERIFHHDTTFAYDLVKHGIQNLYVPIICRHENQRWDVQRQMIQSG